MADQRITQLVELSKAGAASNDVLPVVDISGSETKKITLKNLVAAGVDLIDVNEIDLDKLNQSSTTKIGTTALADGSITYAKIQDLTATDLILGRSSAGSGVVEEISCTAAARSFLDDVDADEQRTTLGLGSLAVQNADSAVLDGVTISSGTIVGITDLAIVDGGTGASTAEAARTNLGVAIGSDVQAYDAGLQSISSLTTGADQSIYLTASDTYAAYSLTSFARTLLDDANASTARNTLGLGDLATLDAVTGSQITDLSIGVDDIADSSITAAKLNLTAGDLAGTLIQDSGIGEDQLAANAVSTVKIQNGAITFAKIQDSSATDVIIGRSTAGAGDFEEIACTAAGRALLDDADAATQRTTLGLGTLATQDGTFSGTHSGDSSGTNTGDQTITLTGPVTGSGTGTFATSLTTGSVDTDALADDGVTYQKIQNTVSTDIVLGRSSAGGGTIQEIPCTSAGRALLDDADAATQRATLGLGDLAVATGTWTNGSTFSGDSSGTNTGDQTITLTGAVTGSGTGTFATTLANDIVLQANIASNAVTTAKINDSAVSAGKLDDESTSVISTAAPSGSGAFVGQGWLDTSTNIAYNWDGSAWQQHAGIQVIEITETTPLSLTFTKPDAFTANLSMSLDTQTANTVFAGPTTGVDDVPTFRTLVGADLPDATASVKGAILPGTGLAIASGTLNHSNTITSSTVSGITFDSEGHISAATALIASDIPELDASKTTSGEFSSARIQDAAITASKLANRSTAQIGETLPVADFIGQMFFNPLDKNFFMWDGNVWQSIGISAGAVVLAGTYDASVNQVDSVTSEGSAIGLSVGQALPSASSSNTNYYLIVSESGTGASPAPPVALDPPDMILSVGSEWLEIDVSSVYTAQTASNVGFTPAASISSTNCQSAIEEVSNECRNASNLTSGTLAVARGGTAITSYAKGDLIAASAATTLSKLSAGTNGYILSANSSTTTGLEWIANQQGTVTNVTGTSPIQVATGTTTPVISVNTATTSAIGVVQLQNSVTSSSNTKAATPNSVKTAYDLANAALPKAGGTVTGQVIFDTAASLVFEGSSPDNFETTLAVANPTADRTVTLPDVSGTVALESQLDDGTYV